MVAKSPSGSRRRRPASWQKKFLAELASSSNVSASAKKAGVSTSHVYDLRRSNAEFNRAWQDALCEGYDLLELETLQRLREGQIKNSTAKRGVRQYENATAIRLLAAHRASVAQNRAMRENEDAEAIIASIDAKLDRMRARALKAAGKSPDADD